MTGLARITLFVGIANTVHSMRQLQNWHARTGNGDPEHPLLAPDSDAVLLHLTPEEYAEIEASRLWREARKAQADEAGDGREAQPPDPRRACTDRASPAWRRTAPLVHGRLAVSCR